MKKLVPFIVIILFAVLLLVMGKDARHETPDAEAYRQHPILAFGDSLTYGTGADPQQSYPAILQRISGVKVVNAGVPGETSAEGLARLETELDKHRPALLILCHGGNDILRNLPRKALKNNLSDMIHLAHSRNIDILLVGLPDISTLGFGTIALYEELADAEGTMYEEGILRKIERNVRLKSDRIHPTAEGYRMMAETFYEVLKAEGRL
jgi:lysophospholipase L1-like esterase